jgi:hypothetical protein
MTKYFVKNSDTGKRFQCHSYQQAHNEKVAAEKQTGQKYVVVIVTTDSK